MLCGYIYVLIDDVLFVFVMVIEILNVFVDGKVNVVVIVVVYLDVKIVREDVLIDDLFFEVLKDNIDDGDVVINVFGLLLIEFVVMLKFDMMVIFYFGDGGWCDIDI